jgi:hypothetical protein
MINTVTNSVRIAIRRASGKFNAAIFPDVMNPDTIAALEDTKRNRKSPIMTTSLIISLRRDDDILASFSNSSSLFLFQGDN